MFFSTVTGADHWLRSRKFVIPNSSVPSEGSRFCAYLNPHLGEKVGNRQIKTTAVRAGQHFFTALRAKATARSTAGMVKDPRWTAKSERI